VPWSSVAFLPKRIQINELRPFPLTARFRRQAPLRFGLWIQHSPDLPLAIHYFPQYSAIWDPKKETEPVHMQIASIQIDAVPLLPLGEVFDVFANCRSSHVRQTGSLFEATVETDDVDELGHEINRALERVLATRQSAHILERLDTTTFHLRPPAA
jgi:hypothetical protein